MATWSPIPYTDIKTLFLDVGNTLISIDFPWIRDELRGLGISCATQEVRRAEAAARPLVSAEIGRLKSTESVDTFRFYLLRLVERLPGTTDLGHARRSELVAELAPALERAGKTRLWSYVLPGVRESLASLWEANLQMVVVSNSDGTVEEVLVEQGLRNYFVAVLDSHRVGYEKPDPRIFQCALDLVGSEPRTTLHVGDLYHVDVVGARAALLHALLLDPFGDWTDSDCERLPDLVSLEAKLVRR